MGFFSLIERVVISISDWIWGFPLLVLLLGGGLVLLVYSGFVQFNYLWHAIGVLTGRHTSRSSAGEISHYGALSSALAATVGMGNIAGVAIAIVVGGPGAIFWMWMSAFVGMSTKFFTCTLSAMYRGKDSLGAIQGGPMYVITKGLGNKWKPFAYVFCLAGAIGCLPIFQANQLTEIVREVVLIPNGWYVEPLWVINFSIGVVVMMLVSSVIFGGIKRIASVASKLVPFMVVFYLVAVIYIIIANIGGFLSSVELIVRDAFSGDAVAGGVIGSVILMGARGAAFSNEAGIGTAPMAHGAAKTEHPVQQGLVAMLGPAIDTLIVCSLTAIAILSTGVWENASEGGIALTAIAFRLAMGEWGVYVLMIAAFVFSITSMFSYSYYTSKCLSFISGATHKTYYNIFYILTIIFGAVFSVTTVKGVIEIMYAVMAVPTMLSTFLLASKVKKSAKSYFRSLRR